MELRNFLKSSAAVALLALAVVGCNENPGDPTDPDPVNPTPATNMQATSLAPDEVGIKWNASADTGITGYRVSWNSFPVGDSGSTDVAANINAVDISNLHKSATTEFYTFYVRTLRGTAVSTPISIQWAGAARQVNDVSVATTLRMYEKASSNGSGLTIDPALGGPRNRKTANPDGTIQLAMVVTTVNGVDSVIVGPAFSFPEYKNVDNFDANVHVSSSSYLANSLDEWYLNKPLDTYIRATDGNLSAFYFPTSAAQGRGFIVRTGTSANYHYARVFVKSVGGKILQGTAPNRYVEVEMSYQTRPGVAFAKGRAESPKGESSRRMP